ncbi:MAG: RlmE family RNA methyltransferase [Bacteroidia bacterium]|nr:RlmE family RNA methyltransferase [Bacteroidia bacterium]
MPYNPQDHYFKKAKQENYLARSVYKLKEINERFKLIKPGMNILDLGASPGSWSQYASEQVGLQGKVVGIDITPITLQLPNAIFLTADINAPDTPSRIEAEGISQFQMVISDMAPKTTGVKVTDQARSFQLCEMALWTARKYLANGGHFICKLFHGSEFEDFRKDLRKSFRKVEILRPQSTRKESKEIFLIGIDFNGFIGVY